MKRNYIVGVADFETTVYDKQTETEVWSAAYVELYTDDVIVKGSINAIFDYWISLDKNLLIYFHNLKFDGTFILSYLLKNGYEQAWSAEDGFAQAKDMKAGQVAYNISAKGQWYQITVIPHNPRGNRPKVIRFMDSLKLMPFSLAEIGKAFETEHQKLTMEYKGKRYANCPVSSEELEYIKNDVLCLKEAMEYMYNEGHTKMTIGSCCFEEFKGTFQGSEFERLLPNLYDMPIDENVFGQNSVGEYIVKAYKGGWCYLRPAKANKLYTDGITLDVNSLYPYVMHSDSGNYYPYGEPVMLSSVSCETLDTLCRCDTCYFYIRLTTRFYLKKGKLPTIQIKGNYIYKGTEWLTTSDVWDSNAGVWSKQYYNHFGDLCEARPTLTLTKTDYILLKEHYNLEDTEIHDICLFEKTIKGLFDEYIDKYKAIKMNSKGAKRTLAKLYSNNLYGKMATYVDSSYKYAFLNDEGILKFLTYEERKKTPGYIAIGAAITSYARAYTIRAAQANYKNFIYADTDSIHCHNLSKENAKGVIQDDRIYGCWKCEAEWQQGLFVRQKTYCEVSGNEIDIKCAGLPKRGKELFKASITREIPEELEKTLTEQELAFVNEPRKLSDFKVGIVIPGKLMPVQIPGGTLLVDTTFEMR